jgi:hypothetical protein
VELISAYGHGLTGDVLLKSYFPFGEQDREIPLQDFSEVARRALSYDISVSKPRGTCIPTLSDLNCLRCSFSLLLVSLSGPRVWRLLDFAGIAKLLLSPGKAGGLLRRNYSKFRMDILAPHRKDHHHFFLTPYFPLLQFFQPLLLKELSIPVTSILMQIYRAGVYFFS